MRPQAELHRLALVGDKLVADVRGKLPGRGAYVCGRACAERGLTGSTLSRSFRRRVEPDHEVVESLGD